MGGAEGEFPAAARQLVSVVGGLVGDQRTTQEKLRDGMANIDVGLALIGDWLKETGADGFEVKLGFGGGAKKAIGKKQVKFPSLSDLIRVGGKVDPELQTQILPLLCLFSRQIEGGLDVGLSPRQIVGGLVAESVGSGLSEYGSANLRGALSKPLGGHFEWLREALKIPDVATQPEFMVKEAAPTPADKKRGETAKREETSSGEKKLPSFLTGDELLEGYVAVHLRPEEKQFIQLGLEPESEMVVYVGNVGVRLERSADGKVFFSLLGFNLPKNIYPQSDDGVSLTNIGLHGIPLAEEELMIRLSSGLSSTVIDGRGLWKSILLYLPGGYQKLGFGLLGPAFRVEEGGITVENDSSINPIRIVAPAAMVGERSGGVEAAARREEIARAAEVDLTDAERNFVLSLENLADVEGQTKPPDASELQTSFMRMRSLFSNLPADSGTRAEITKNVMGQLGEDGEKLRKAGKDDEAIFGEWLKRVFTPLYRRAGRK